MAVTETQSTTESICAKYNWNRQQILDNALNEIKTHKLKISKDTFRKRVDRCLEKHDGDIIDECNDVQDNALDRISRYGCNACQRIVLLLVQIINLKSYFRFILI